MKRKVAQDISLSLAPVKLFFQDVAQISEILSNAVGSVEFRTTDWIFDDLDLLKSESGTLIRTLEIKSFRPSSFRETNLLPAQYISIDFREWSVRIYASDPDLKVRGAVQAIRELLDERRRHILSLVKPSIPLAFSALALLLLVPVWAALTSDNRYREGMSTEQLVNDPIGRLLLGTMGLVFLASVLAILFLRGKGNAITLRPRAELGSPWSRHKEIIIPVIAAAVGACVGAVVIYLLGSGP